MQTPWSNVIEKNEFLSVGDFPITLIVQLGNALRRSITTKYANDFGLSESEWRLLTLIVNFQPISMVDLVNISASDKALVSRTVKSLVEKKLINLLPDPSGNLKKIICDPTPEGIKLHHQIFPIAQKKQIEILSKLTTKEREIFYHCLQKLLSEYS